MPACRSTTASERSSAPSVRRWSCSRWRSALVIAYNHRFQILGWHHGRHHTATQNALQTPLQIARGGRVGHPRLGAGAGRQPVRGPDVHAADGSGDRGDVRVHHPPADDRHHGPRRPAVAGAQLQTLALGGGFTAVVFGLAAQQTLGNAIAGMVLLSARPFRVGERIRLQAGAVGGQVEGIVSSLGLLYTTLTRGADQIMIPNNVVLAAAVMPLREPDSVDVKVRLTSGVRPSQVQAILDNEIGTPTSSKAGCCSRRSTATTWSCASRRRRRSPTTARSSPTRSSPRCHRSPASTRTVSSASRHELRQPPLSSANRH